MYNDLYLAGHIASISNPQRISCNANGDTLKIKHTADFEIKGDGSASNWNNSEWIELLRGEAAFLTKRKLKMLYSDSVFIAFIIVKTIK
jgi:hypothetical protein